MRFTAILVLLGSTMMLGANPGDLSYNKIFKSETLGYDLHYRVYTPDGYDGLENLPVIYVTDGQWYISNGKVHKVMDRLIESGEVEPAIVVFIDNRDPYDPSNNRRNRQFFCNTSYIDFVTDELVPYIDQEYSSSQSRDDRVILGLSFGGLNSACFGVHASDVFRGIAMQSPATHPVPSLGQQLMDLENPDLKVFLSTGTIRDNLGQTRKLRDILQDVGVEMEYVDVEASHDWGNWAPLIDDVLKFYLGSE